MAIHFVSCRSENGPAAEAAGGSIEPNPGPTLPWVYIKSPQAFPMDGLQKWLQDKKIGAIVIPNRTSKANLARLALIGVPIYVSVPIFMGKREWLKHKHLRPIDKTGRYIAPQGWYHGLNPHNRDLRQGRLKRVQQAAQRPGVAGVFLDFIRYPIFWETKSLRLVESGFDAETMDSFMKTATAMPHQLKAYHQARNWAGLRKEVAAQPQILAKFRKYKEQVIHSFVGQAAQTVRTIGKKLGIFFVPAAPFFDQGPDLQNIVHQPADDLIDLCDIGAPMLFHQMMGRSTRWLDKAHGYYRPRFGSKYRPVLQTFSVTKADLLGRISRNNGRFGMILFHAEALHKAGY